LGFLLTLTKKIAEYYAINDEGVSGTVRINWYVAPTTTTPYYVISGILLIVLSSVYLRRRKMKS